MVGIVVINSPNCNLYNIVVFPAASNPNMRIRFSDVKRPKRRAIKLPILIEEKGFQAIVKVADSVEVECEDLECVLSTISSIFAAPAFFVLIFHCLFLLTSSFDGTS